MAPTLEIATLGREQVLQFAELLELQRQLLQLQVRCRVHETGEGALFVRRKSGSPRGGEG